MTCGGTLTATEVKFVLNAKSDYFRALCKIGIFGQLSLCTDLLVTITEDSWTVSTTTFDLLLDTSKTITLPTLTISPVSCYTTTWTAHKLAGDSDIVSTSPTNYGISSPNFTITHTVTDFAQRASLFGL